jgi:phosphoribosylformylglycinamidine cyclo-ligase
VLSKHYAEQFPETFEPSLNDNVVYIGKHKLADHLPAAGNRQPKSIGQLLLSPTRTYAPLMKVLLENHFDNIFGVIHCSGGGQTKCMKYLPRPLKIIKDNLFEIPEIFKLIQQSSGADHREMYQVFNMGHRLEIFTDEKTASAMIAEAAKFNVEARVVGHVEQANNKELQLHVDGNVISF